jgi:hypothetical protein
MRKKIVCSSTFESSNEGRYIAGSSLKSASQAWIAGRLSRNTIVSSTTWYVIGFGSRSAARKIALTPNVGTSVSRSSSVSLSDGPLPMITAVSPRCRSRRMAIRSMEIGSIRPSSTWSSELKANPRQLAPTTAGPELFAG